MPLYSNDDFYKLLNGSHAPVLWLAGSIYSQKQTDRGEPYFLKLIRAAMLVWMNTRDIEIVCATFLKEVLRENLVKYETLARILEESGIPYHTDILRMCSSKMKYIELATGDIQTAEAALYCIEAMELYYTNDLNELRGKLKVLTDKLRKLRKANFEIYSEAIYHLTHLKNTLGNES